MTCPWLPKAIRGQTYRQIHRSKAAGLATPQVGVKCVGNSKEVVSSGAKEGAEWSGKASLRRGH